MITLAHLTGRAFAMRRDVLDAIVELARSGRTLEALAAARHDRPTGRVPRSIGIVPLVGPLEHRPSLFSELLGGTSTAQAAAAVDAFAADPDVQSIVLLVDSPGGEVAGATELAQRIRSARNRKPVIAAISTMAGSAAYWAAAQASEIVVSPSGGAGSIGVFLVHEDLSRALDKAGIAPTVISAGRYKSEGMPHEPLSDDARGHLQRQVNQLYGQFVADVALGRGVSTSKVRSGFGEGRYLLATDALREGMVDRIGTFEEALALAGRGSRNGVQALRGRAEQRELAAYRARAARR